MATARSPSASGRKVRPVSTPSCAMPPRPSQDRSSSRLTDATQKRRGETNPPVAGDGALRPGQHAVQVGVGEAALGVEAVAQGDELVGTPVGGAARGGGVVVELAPAG